VARRARSGASLQATLSTVPKRPEPPEHERLAAIRAKHAAGQPLEFDEVRLLLEVLDRRGRHLAEHPLKRLHAELEQQHERVSRRLRWRQELLRLVEKELRKLAADPIQSTMARQALGRRAERIDKRLAQRDPPEGWSPVGIPGQEWRADPDEGDEKA
jgi:hypothetical protein